MEPTIFLFGGFGNDVHNGGIGADNMQGGFGNDTYFVDNGADFVFEAVGAGIDRIVSSISITLNIASRANVENLSLTGGAFFGVGNALGNSIVGTNFANNLQGLGGNDGISGTNLANNLQGLGGNDTILGFAGNDLLGGGANNDLLDGGLGADFMNGGGFGNDSFQFSYCTRHSRYDRSGLQPVRHRQQ